MPGFDGFFLFWNVGKVKVDLVVNEKNGTIKSKFIVKFA